MTARADTGASTPSKPTRPRSVDLATVAVGAQLLFALVYAGLSWGFTDQFRQLIIDNNNKAHPVKALCETSHVSGCLDVTKSIHAFRLTVTQSSVLIGVLVVLLTVMFRRGSGTGRWIFIVLCVVGGQLGFAGTPLQVLVATSNLPKAMGVAGTLSALAAIVAIVMLVVPTSAAWFRAMKMAANPGAAQRPAGLGSLFAPRRPPATPAPRATGRAAANTRGTAANPARAKSKARVRADADAVAKGAELARSRAKANKSRRTD